MFFGRFLAWLPRHPACQTAFLLLSRPSLSLIVAVVLLCTLAGLSLTPKNTQPHAPPQSIYPPVSPYCGQDARPSSVQDPSHPIPISIPHVMLAPEKQTQGRDITHLFKKKGGWGAYRQACHSPLLMPPQSRGVPCSATCSAKSRRPPHEGMAGPWPTFNGWPCAP
jgi:hypothetical protein